MTNDNTCKNCKHFVKHYLKDKYGRFKLIDGAGHCMHPDLPLVPRRKILQAGAQCERFEPEEVNPQENKRVVLDKLKHAKLLLSDITHILKEDKT